MRLFGFRPKEEEAMREQIDSRIRQVCNKAAREREVNQEDFIAFVNDLKKEVMPGKTDRIEAVVDAIKKLIKDTDEDSPSKFYALLVTYHY
jgi:hypothetical protein